MKKPMFILLEGPDASGKTTFAEFVKAQHEDGQYHYIHLTYIKDNVEMFLANYEALKEIEQKLAQGITCVLDRGWVSEQVYSRVYRGGSQLIPECRWLDAKIRKMGGVLLMAVPEVHDAVLRHAKSHSEREEMYEPDDRIQSVARAYFNALHGILQEPFTGEPFVYDYLEIATRKGPLIERSDVVHYDVSKHGHDLLSVYNRVVKASERK